MNSAHSITKITLPQLSINRLVKLAIDTVCIMFALSIVGFIVSNFVRAEYMITGYNDWFYHAYKIESIQNYGITSWDFVWGNGLNHWKLYQYIPHLLTLWLQQWSGLSITSSMLWACIAVIVASILMSYITMRKAGIRSVAALLGVVCFLTVPQVWSSMKDFSILFGLLILPIYTYLWIMAIKSKKVSAIIPAVAGISWMIHPTLAYITAGMWGFLLLIVQPSFKTIIKHIFVYLWTSSVFWLSYITKDYAFSNPYFSNPQFIRENSRAEWHNLGKIIGSILIVGWIPIVLRPLAIPKWTIYLLSFCSIYYLLIVAGDRGLIPQFLLQTQYFRGVHLIGLLLSYVVASEIEVLCRYSRPLIFALSLMALGFISITAIDTSSQWLGTASNVLPNPTVDALLNNQSSVGSIFVDNIGEASYTNGVKRRFINSYFEQMLPNPLVMRIAGLLRNDLSFTGISDKQVTLISAYARVLGIEYFVMPQNSPIASTLLRNGEANNTQIKFEAVDDSQVQSRNLILHGTQPINYGYAVIKPELINLGVLPKPTMHSASWKAWDDAVVMIDQQILNGDLLPVPTEIIKPNKVKIVLGESDTKETRNVLLMINYDKNWHAGSGVTINPTQERLTLLTITDPSITEINLENSWPSWYFPSQMLAIGAVPFILLVKIVKKIRNRKKND